MKAIIRPSRVKGTIQAPASKSSMQRACAAALVRTGITVLHNPGHSNDDRAAMDIIRRAGAVITEEANTLRIESHGINPVDQEVNCGESGLSIRMFTPLLALSDQSITINGSGSLVRRPMDFFDEILPKLGVKVVSNNGKLPLTVQGPVVPGDIEVDGSLSSQFLTGLLMAYAAADAGDVTITVNDLRSRPYIDLTLDVMRRFGMKVPENKDYRQFYFDRSKASLPAEVEYTVEGDWSGAAFLLVAGAIAGPLTVRGLDLSSTQADRAIIDALMAANAGIAMDQKGIHLHPSPLDAFEFDATDCPDLFPPLVALAAAAQGRTSIKGVSRLAHKESDRGEALKSEFGKLGIEIVLDGDYMHITGGPIKGAEVHSHHDHRIAMACAVAALRAEGEVVILDAEAIRKSYPDFYTDLRSAGAAISLPYEFIQ